MIRLLVFIFFSFQFFFSETWENRPTLLTSNFPKGLFWHVIINRNVSRPDRVEKRRELTKKKNQNNQRQHESALKRNRARGLLFFLFQLQFNGSTRRDSRCIHEVSLDSRFILITTKLARASTFSFLTSRSRAWAQRRETTNDSTDDFGG